MAVRRRHQYELNASSHRLSAIKTKNEPRVRDELWQEEEGKRDGQIQYAGE